MTRTPVTSTSIASIGHDALTHTLEVEFKNGGVYTYAGVTPQHFDDLMKAPSLGKHFQQHIRSGGFTHTKLG